MAAITAAPGEVLEQHCRAGPSADQTPGPPWTWLREILDGTTNIGGYEAMAMIGKGRIRRISGGDIEAQAVFIAELFKTTA
jgi:hypothetical protein